MISANETWILWSIIIVIATASIYLENHYAEAEYSRGYDDGYRDGYYEGELDWKD